MHDFNDEMAQGNEFIRPEAEKYQIAKAAHFIRSAKSLGAPDVSISTETAGLLIECYSILRKMNAGFYRKLSDYDKRHIQKLLIKLNRPTM